MSEIVGDRKFSNERAQKKLKVRNEVPFVFQSVGYPLKREAFVMLVNAHHTKKVSMM